MTAEIPMLTPADTPIFDDMVIVDLEKHWDDEIACDDDDCDAAASWRHVHTCCLFTETYCDSHHLQEHQFVADLVAHRGVECDICDHPYAKGTPIEDVQREVPL